jgi:F420-dependent oxidoreductase-like protein
VRIGIFSGVSATGSIDDVVADVQAAEAQGFHAYWVPQIFGYDALTLLAVLGRETSGIGLGTSVVPTFPRHPTMLAAQALTTQQACGGRLTLGIGLSHQPVVEHVWGMRFDRPVRHLREYLDALMPLLQGQAVDVEGELISARVTLDVPRPQPVPVQVAALGPQMLRLAGERTEGTITWMTGPRTIAEHTAPTIRRAAEAVGNPEPVITAGVPVCVTDDVDAVRRKAAQTYAIYGQLPSYRAMLDREGMDGPADLAVIGDEDTVRERLLRYAEAGVTDLALQELGPAAQQERTRELLQSLR